jgi:uncharacterized transporter YbjL
MGRYCTPQEVGDAVVFLASDNAAYITGYGGMTSTPGLGAVIQLTDSEEAAITYAAAFQQL